MPYTDAGWAAYAEERQAHYARVNAARRAACWQQQAAYWQERRALAQTWLASTAEVTIPALPPGWPAHNAIDHFLAARCLEVQQSEPPTHELPVRFHQHIKPILEAQCWGCHSGSRPKGGLRLDLRESALRGGDSGEPALVPGNLSASVLWQRVTADDPALRMPPQRDPLSPEQLELLTAWINAGAPWPQVSAVRLQPTALCADEVFLRRVFLDTLGVIPTWSEIADFFTQPADTRREWLITRCLHDPRWADHWVSYWQDVLAENPNILNPTLNNTGPFRWWLYEALSDHKPLDVLVTELVRLRGSERFGGPAGFAIASQNDAPLAEKGMILAAAFLGVNMKCARCHDAPAHVSRQQDLFGLAAMLQREAVKVPTTSSVPVDALHRGGRQPLITVTLPPGSVVPPTWPFPQFIEPALAERYAQDPHDLRDRLAALITLPQNERFPQVLANRIWQRLFGRGLIEPVDDWERGHVTHPELLRWLGRELVRSGYDLRHLVGLILRSHAYQREADLTLAAPDPLVMAPVSRRMTAEQIVDSAFVATGKPFRLEEVSLDIDGIRDLDNSITLGQPRRAWMLTSTSNERDRPSLSLPRIQAVVDVLQAYGWRGARQDPVSTRDHTPNVLQPALLAHSTLGRWLTRLSDDHGITQLALETPDLPHLVDQLFWRFLTRPPRPHERTECLAYLTPGFEQRVLPPPPPPPASGRRQRPFYVSWSNHLDPEATVLRQQEEAAARAGDPPTQRLDPAWRQRLEDVVWSLLNHAEFLFYP
ncbi:MAG: hypothetical protein KatS3mg114_1295 [Planctomycetaceae bacterium]|nr:MAG: hypothetical protein KatS3mg114_1295 [Planctomycetaceae bacterium]